MVSIIFPLSFLRLLAFFMPARTPFFYKQSFGISLTCPVYGDPSTLSESSIPKKSAQKRSPPGQFTGHGQASYGHTVLKVVLPFSSVFFRSAKCLSVLFYVLPFC
jgi:hypothetical protein